MASRQLGMLEFKSCPLIPEALDLPSEDVKIRARTFRNIRLSREHSVETRTVAEALELLAWMTLERRAKNGRR